MVEYADPTEAFSAQYREFMANALDRFEFFGVDPQGIPRRHHFANGYVPLTLNRRDPGDDTTVSAGVRADRALADHPRALIRGVAGSGKSTLLRWLGRAAATDTVDGRIPFVVELARFPGGVLPSLDELIADPLRRQAPEGWLHRVLSDGKVLLLLDGMDEVRPRERAEIEMWVDAQLAAYPHTRCIATTRPTVVAEKWWVDRNFQRFDLLQMSRHTMTRYVRGWHKTAREDQPDTPAGEVAKQHLSKCENDLLVTLSNRPALRGLSANPLLCGLLCALHLERGEHLPENRKQVYEEALELLLVRWPHLRRLRRLVGTPATGEETIAADIALSSEELKKLLQRLAFWLVTNKQMVLKHDKVRDRVVSSMSGLRGSEESPDRVVRYLAQESGLLRELPDGSLEFVHRTFRDHLAAKEVVEESYLELMLDNADKPNWHDVVVMAGAHARPNERTQILIELLERGNEDTEHGDALYLLAGAILEQTTVLPGPTDIYVMVREAMAKLVPPRSSAAADQLASTGPFVLDLLPAPHGRTPDEAILVVRTLAQIAARWDNPAGVVDKILQYTADSTPEMLNQLLAPWGRHGDYETYARDVLSEIDFTKVVVDLRNRRRIEHIGYLRSITTLLLGDNVVDLAPLAGLPRLRRLILRSNTRTSLRSLGQLPSLRSIELFQCSAYLGSDSRDVDLSPLRDKGLPRLIIGGNPSNVDVDSLVGVPLNSMRLDGAALLGRDALPDGLTVRHLCLLTRGRRVDLSGLRGLQTLIIDRVPTWSEVAALAASTGLRRLVLVSVPADTVLRDVLGVQVRVWSSLTEVAAR